MALHFDVAEYRTRQQATREQIAAAGLHGLLLFRQESMYYLSGYDTFGFCFFQCLYLGVDGQMTLLTRAPDLRQARHTSTLDDIRIWVDGEDHPATRLREILVEHGAANQRLGVEWDAYGLTAWHGRELDAALAGFCTLEDASLLVSRLRAIKSPAELAYIRRAAILADDAFEAGLAETRPGAFEGDILAAMQGAVFKGGGDYPGNEFIIGSGHDALLCRYFTGRRHLDATDQLTLEWAGAYRHYHAAMMRTVVIGQPSAAHRAMFAACNDAMTACIATLRPGAAVSAVFQAHADTLDQAGFRESRLNACGYSQGATFSPIWMDWPMFHAGNEIAIAAGMVFFIHIILMDSGQDRAMTLGQTVIVTETGCELLSRLPSELTAME